jgi:hypothetical protein
MANSEKIDLEPAMMKSMQKLTVRDKDRFEKKKT